jgi:hypothetical protein
MGAAESTEQLPDRLDLVTFADLAGDKFSVALFEANCDDDDEVPIQRAKNLLRQENYRIMRDEGLHLKDFIKRGYPMSDLVVGGYTVKQLRIANFEVPGMDLLEPLEVDWSVINERDESSFTLLHSAASQGCTQVALTLIEKEAEIEKPDKKFWTCIHWAAYNSHTGKP